MALDSTNKAHISYYDDVDHELAYITNASGTWVKTPIDTTGSSSSIALDASDKVHIAYDAPSPPYYRGVKYATNSSGEWLTTFVDGKSDAGTSPSIAVDALNHVHIAYSDCSHLFSEYCYPGGDVKCCENYDLKYAVLK